MPEVTIVHPKTGAVLGILNDERVTEFISDEWKQLASRRLAEPQTDTICPGQINNKQEEATIDEKTDSDE